MEPGSAPQKRPRGWRAAVLLLAPALLASVLVGCQPAGPAPAPTGSPKAAPAQSPTKTAAPASPAPSPVTNPGGPPAQGTPGHVFVINLENKNYDTVWGGNSPAPYLAETLRSQGVLLTNYYGISHNSLPNYLAQISGQPPNDTTKQDCRTYTEFHATGNGPDGTLQGNGCVYPKDTQTLAGQLSAQGKTWKGYMEDMQQPCEHPNIGEADNHIRATREEMYSTHHNPFVYFHSILSSPDCANNVVNYSALADDLKNVDTTPNLAYITPNLCHDGHDESCADGTGGGMGTVDNWLKDQVPAILSSPAYQLDGMLVITFDEAEVSSVGPSSGDAGSPAGGAAGGRVGALVLSPFSTAGASSDQPYNHYSLLATIEDLFHLPRLGMAGDPGVKTFNSDVLRQAS
ncbi:alkaline phosphatase family protein [Pseudarthrobacter sp. NIBRBAC000502770]|uniref:alkaline phosphatase family protein n=1 Tax=Pseudarthrobacter sp. NIBRBAC000502770 TaxID=2590785 RepID=UPI001140377C|nr:alkaline phosphatase family protein [Pseudarthrobacter sp. NIBRBAC000502770]QDG89489.1 phosphoesterase [Pseudarthrobacter sp. NIBRBAC000502770]